MVLNESSIVRLPVKGTYSLQHSTCRSRTTLLRPCKGRPVSHKLSAVHLRLSMRQPLAMPRRDFHRSKSEALPPTERAYRRAERELREFHRTRSLDVILEEDHHLLMERSKDHANSSGGILTKKRAVLCLADLANEQHQPEEPSGSESSAECEVADVAVETKEHCSGWGHFTADSPSESRVRTIPHPVHKRTIRRFGRS